MRNTLRVYGQYVGVINMIFIHNMAMIIKYTFKLLPEVNAIDHH